MNPGIQWYTETMMISNKFKIGGTVDLVGDMGDGRLIVFDFKTTDDQLADDKMVATDKYKTVYSLLLPPFQSLPQSKYNIHMLQTNMYANMLETKKLVDLIKPYIIQTMMYKTGNIITP